MELIGTLILIGNLILCISFIYILIEKIENTNNVKIPYLSLVLLLLYILINLLTTMSADVNISHKIFCFITFIAIVGILYIKITTSSEENYCNQYAPYKLPHEYEEYYKKVMNRGKNEYIQPNYRAFAPE
jgi:hypothetical protein